MNSDIDVSANVSDPDGSVSSVKADVWEDGTQIVSDAQLSDSDGDGTWEASNLFSVDESSVNYNISLTATDDDGATATYEMSQLIQNLEPKINHLKPQNNSEQFTYTPEYEILIEDDGDNVPSENITCDLYSNGERFREVWALEDDTQSERTFSGELNEDVGSNEFKTRCVDGDIDNTTTFYETRYSKIQDVSSPSPVYETENTSFETEIKVGDMVNNVDTQLDYNGSIEASNTVSTTGIENLDEVLHYEIPLVSTNQTTKNWSIEFDLNISDFQNSTTSNVQESTGQQTQEVEWAYHSPVISNTQDRVIEAENFNASTDFTTELPEIKANYTCRTSFNDSTKTGCNNEYDTPVFNDTASVTKTVDGNVTFTFKDSERTVDSSTDDISVYRKILTDCSNAALGETGEKALTFYLKNEENRSQNLTGSIDFNFDTTHHGEHTRNFAFENTGVKSSSICLYPGWAEYRITGPVQYESLSGQNDLGVDFLDRRYDLFNETVNNISESTDLYLLSDGYATPVYFQVEDSDGSAVQGVTIQVLRYFVGSNSYLTVAKSTTDSQGVGTTYMRINEIEYKYILTKEGETLLETGREIFACQSSPCSKTFRIDPEVQSPYYQTKEGFSYSCGTYTDSEGNISGFQCSVDHESDVIGEARLEVDKKGAIGWDEVCDISVTSASSSMVCQFNESVEGNVYEYRLTAEKDGFSYVLEQGTLDYSRGFFEEEAEVVALTLFLTLSMLGLVSPSVSIFFSTLGVLAAAWLGLLTVGMAALGSIVVVAVIMALSGRS